MNKLFVSLIFGFLSLMINAQPSENYTIDGIKFSEIVSNYVQVIVTNNVHSTRVYMQFDFGQGIKYLGKGSGRMVYPTGEEVKFNSIITVLNFMTSHGYEYIDKDVVIDKTMSIYHHHHLFKKNRIKPKI